MTTITTEIIEQYAEGDWPDNFHEGIKQMARMLLAGMEQEPFATAHRLVSKHNGQVHNWVLTLGKIDASEGDIFRVEVKHLYAAPPPAPIVMKDHQIRELVNELRDLAIEYHCTQQLREHIARAIRTALLQGGTLIDEDTTKQTWINCSEQMPEDDSVVLVADERGIVWCAEVQGGEIYPDEFPGVRGFGCAEAICWMPLPAAPKQEVNRE
ncbi:DUF551 domain-containing protein [Enterobacter asburiae]|uniref:DUF551 domain-containing protein n=1 Tax=Enterobacter asburiae TaxID=61645 RepID=UPI00068ADFEC|nr:DUF551 domain-containing protein [Enterobacter asburiae]AVG34839.1 DUF551 domain-containing protein [Enterobacter cloacae complex sp.]